jgi:hypothetical protein
VLKRWSTGHLEVFIVSGRLYDKGFDIWLEAGHYASRPPGERHGSFKTLVGKFRRWALAVCQR